MKLYSDDQSPFCAPVRAAIYAKGLDLSIEPPPGGLKSEEYARASLTGTIPCLVLDDGSPLPESAVIIDYLEDRFPEPALLPQGPEARARVRLLRAFAQDLTAAVVGLFHDLQEGGGEAAKARAREKMERALGLLETSMSEDGFVAGADFTLADCVLGPALQGVPVMGPLVGRPTLLEDHPRVAAYFGRVSQHPPVGRVLGEVQAALAASGFSFG
ncbi:glutathione S-transferase family protein [Phenylobacterium soli]|uniref:Glutathione S-transferase family protein n=1 Tax=Phenylobacterium soli TaxID=2170551 RepID=A0A328AJ46_9CAUL|nr:glutathione S-transferase family protein [Phenylobacterium soli]RAK53444.1 hypothetical protein DJ017_02320 [Phenylobacterium soli]